MYKYADRLRTQQELVTKLEDDACVAEKAGREAREKATKARLAYEKKVRELTPKNPSRRPAGMWAINSDKKKAGKRTESKADKIRKEAAARAEIAQMLAK